MSEVILNVWNITNWHNDIHKARHARDKHKNNAPDIQVPIVSVNVRNNIRDNNIWIYVEMSAKRFRYPIRVPRDYTILLPKVMN